MRRTVLLTLIALVAAAGIAAHPAAGGPRPKPAPVACLYTASGPNQGRYAGAHEAEGRGAFADGCPAVSDSLLAAPPVPLGEPAPVPVCADTATRVLPPLGASLDSAYADWYAHGGCPPAYYGR